MSGGRIDRGFGTDSEFGDQVMDRIGLLSKELAAIRLLLEREHSLDKALQEYRYLPLDLENPIRWGFMGTWGEAGSNYAFSVHTNTQEKYFDEPDTSDENVAAFAAAFTNPNTIRICKYLFRNRENTSREEVKKGCHLSDEELDTAVKPLLEWQFVEWKDERLEGVSSGICYAVTLVGMTKTAISDRTHRERK